jgi:hypothetical protein
VAEGEGRVIAETTSGERLGVLICYGDSRVRWSGGIGYWMMGTHAPLEASLWYGPERGWEPVKEKK